MHTTYSASNTVTEWLLVVKMLLIIISSHQYKRFWLVRGHLNFPFSNNITHIQLGKNYLAQPGLTAGRQAVRVNFKISKLAVG